MFDEITRILNNLCGLGGAHASNRRHDGCPLCFPERED